MSRDIFNSIRLLRAPANLTLNTSRDGAPTSPLGNLFQCFTTLIVKNIFLVPSLKLPSFSLEPLPLVLSQQALLKNLSPPFLWALFKYWKATIMSPHRLLFSRLNSPNCLSLSSQERCSVPKYTVFAYSFLQELPQNNKGFSPSLTCCVIACNFKQL